MQNFAIKNVKTNLFWSNLDGWVSDGFDLFTLDESEYFGLPIDGKWVKFSNTMQTFTVTKTVEYQYTIVADSAEQAEKLAVDYGTIEANQWTNLDIVAESNEEYEQSLEG